jgi:hypothetical protein
MAVLIRRPGRVDLLAFLMTFLVPDVSLNVLELLTNLYELLHDFFLVLFVFH